MSRLLTSLRATVALSALLAFPLAVAYLLNAPDQRFTEAVLRWLHTAFGAAWFGLLIYFNFVQLRVAPRMPAELRPAIARHIAPEALFWFRWAAVATVVAGLLLACSRGYLGETLSLGATEGFATPAHTLIGIGMWLGLIMAANVWGVIWPAQRRALGMVEASEAERAAAARRAMLGARFNLVLGMPMLAAMTMSQTIFG